MANSFITMTKKHKQRLVIVFLIIAGVGATVGLAVSAFSENMLFFFTPSEILAGKAPADKTIRIGGMVTTGSLQRAKDSLTVQFTVTDTVKTMMVEYTGILPDLFREGQGVVAIGKLSSDGVFKASEVLAKHDEKYMPPEAASAIKAAQLEKAKAPQ
ncbi:cytochrome c maturation protein CcmE [Beggiatoa leptomitoformis]|uniref:Cytochrome c-type biogenesis protein CcmE n=1 Tax=Beggiatoa leptomitoformis TaxID=288004 RepID=A0A2N9YJU4_9GAMM|nr:cytochrome c maturation protein CcmE [Beggiatoa leptomitoformis]ALG69406.2 cytochrome c maturation protein CcmE [Beggiatoa leptomitoformis]AUI70666.2 cytochrome c maturation protein CcmE [Beggiatoa leptomitoformis]